MIFSLHKTKASPCNAFNLEKHIFRQPRNFHSGSRRLMVPKEFGIYSIHYVEVIHRFQEHLPGVIHSQIFLQVDTQYTP